MRGVIEYVVTTPALLLSTWSFGMRSNEAGWPILANGGSSLDAVEAVARYAEEDPDNQTVGIGGLPDAGGAVSLDAAIMVAPSRSGAVANVRRHGEAVSIARKVMDTTSHVLLAGEQADLFADVHGFAGRTLLSDAAQSAWQTYQESVSPDASPTINIEEKLSGSRPSDHNKNHDTIGVLALDHHGQLAASCSTSGTAWKLPGRVGDSPLIGHGLYVDPAVGAAVVTGHGELASAVCAAFLAVEQLRTGADPANAGRAVLERVVQVCQPEPQSQAGALGQLGLIVMTADGDWAGSALRPGFFIACRQADGATLSDPAEVLWPD